MNDPVYSAAIYIGRLVWRSAVRAASTATGRRVVARATGMAFAKTAQAGVESLRKHGVSVSPTVEQLATGAAGAAGVMAGGRIAGPPPGQSAGPTVPANPPVSRQVGEPPPMTNPYQGPNPMVPDAVIDARPPIQYGGQ